MSYKKAPIKNGLKTQGFYHTSSWRRVRKVVLQRDNYLCQHCKAHGRITTATEVHHIKALDDHPEFSLDTTNLISLCWKCHELTKSRKSKAISSGVRIIKG